MTFPAESIGKIWVGLETPTQEERLAAGRVDLPANSVARLLITRREPDVLLSLREHDVQSLVLAYDRVPSEDVEALIRLRGLRQLRLLGRGKYDDATCSLVSQLTEMRDLFISPAVNVTDKGLLALTALTGLRALTLRQSRITDSGLSALTHLPRLNSLDISGSRNIKGPGLRFLSRLTDLASLSLAGLPVGDDDLAALGGLRALKSVDFSSTRVTLAGLAHLPANRDLQVSGVGGNPSPAEADEVQERFPHLLLFGRGSTQPREVPEDFYGRLLRAGRPLGALPRAAAGAPLLVLFTTDNCAPCERMKPEVAAVAGRFADAMITVSVHCPEYPDLAGALDILSAPTVTFVTKVTSRRIEGRTRAELTAALSPLLGHATPA